MKKHLFSDNRLIFLQKAPSDKPESEKKSKIFDRMSGVIEKQLTEQYNLRNDIEEATAPIESSKEEYFKITREMKDELLKTGKVPAPREMQAFGKTVHIEIDNSTTASETVDGERIDFLSWAMQQAQKQQKNNNNAN